MNKPTSDNEAPCDSALAASANHASTAGQPATLPRGRSSNLLSVSRSLLLMIDVQERLVPLIGDFERVTWNVGRLLDGAQLLQVAVCATEQYPQGLGPTIARLAKRSPPAFAKRMFSCRECGELARQIDSGGFDQMVVCGLETHVCVQQTVLDFLADGVSVYVICDAVGARHSIDHETALRRMESCGANLTTTESALFEWCETSRHDQFKSLSQLIQKPFSAISAAPNQAPASRPAES